MNGVVRPTVSQSHIAVATRPRLNRHTAAQGDLRVYRQTFGTGGRGSSDHAKITIHGGGIQYSRVDRVYFTLVGISGIYTHGWFHSIYKESRGGKKEFECTINESLQFFHFLGSP